MRTAEREQRAVRVAQDDAFDGAIQSRLAQNARSDAQALLEIDDAVADRRLRLERCRGRVDDRLRVELAAAGQFHPFNVASPIVGAERLWREGQQAEVRPRVVTRRPSDSASQNGLVKALMRGGQGREDATSMNGRLMPRPPECG